MAEKSTQANKETLGFLAGRIDSDELRITHLIVPMQQGDAVSCECLGEVQVAEAFQGQGIIQLGWIHTHPAHDSFLSSFDVHTIHAIQAACI